MNSMRDHKFFVTGIFYLLTCVLLVSQAACGGIGGAVEGPKPPTEAPLVASPPASETPPAGETLPSAQPQATLEGAQSPVLPTAKPGQFLSSQTPSAASGLPPFPQPPPAAPRFPLPGIELFSVNEVKAGLASQAGAYWLRRNGVLWSEIEPVEGERHWDELASLEGEMELAARSGMQLILVVRGTPAWAQSTSGYICSAVKPEKLPAFASFVGELVQRYSQPPYNVKFWEIGNEPDVAPQQVRSESPFGCWGEMGDPYFGGEYYATILKAVYPQVKANDPQAQVLIGGLLLDCDPVNPPQNKDCTPSRYLEGILKGGGGGYFDAVSFHAYDYYTGPLSYENGNWHSKWDSTGPVSLTKARFVRSVLAAYGLAGKPLLNTEAGLLCRSEDAPECQTEAYNLTKAYYIAQNNAMLQAEGVLGNLWFSLEGWRETELVDYNLNPLPAYTAYQFSASRLSGAAFVRSVTDYYGVLVYEFYREGTRLWVAWTLNGEKQFIELPELPSAVYDTLGEPLEATQTLPVAFAPVYIEWAP
jgi:hypothetical protein